MSLSGTRQRFALGVEGYVDLNNEDRLVDESKLEPYDRVNKRTNATGEQLTRMV